MLKGKEGVCSNRYLLYVLNQTDYRGYANGTTRLKLTQSAMRRIPVNLAPLKEQHRIVAKIEELFSELDKGIENLKTAQAQLKVYRQALLKHAFEGKLTAQWRTQRRAKQTVAPAQAGAQLLNDMDSRPTPSRGQAMRGNDEAGSGNDEPLETAEALLKRIQQERAQRYQQQLAEWEESPSIPLLQRGKPTSTAPIPPLEKGGRGGISKPKPPKTLPPLTAEELAELPELPEGWGWVKLGTVVETNVGFAFKSSEFSSNGIRLLRGENIEPRQLRWVDTRFWPSESMGQFNDLLVNPGEIIVAMDRPVISSGLKVARVKQSDVPCLLVQRVARIKEQQNICTSYIFSVIDQNRFINHCLGNQTGTQLPHISEAQIRAYPVPLCSYEEQIKISEELDSRTTEADQLDQTITTALKQAEALRQSILKKAFSGQLVPQDPNDEPASELLARIKAERLASQGNLVVRRKGGRS
ncbi:type I restriction enzyme, S subunit [Nitrosomonas ureae]|uniref:Type I restriction enzyme, S subunit n=1 Tax=Nitrosomonas ureae TaxID=44577 RepID=A0A1H9EDX2_9PROT|nr:type I restriction enzyme, S subunit [Nitrosomonas ureae]